MVKEESRPLETRIESPRGRVVIYAGTSVGFKARTSGGKAPVSARWDFGGAAGAVSREDAGEIVFGKSGLYEACFEAVDAAGAKAGGTVEIEVVEDTKPVCRIILTGEASSVPEGTPVKFEAEVKGGNAPYRFAWDFGKGVPSSVAQAPGAVSFPVASSYPVKLVVRDENGDTSEATVSIEVTRNIPQAAVLTPERESTVYEGRGLRFSGGVTGGNEPFTYHWDFGGAGKSLKKDPGEVVFAKPGTHVVRFTVTDAQGDESSDSVFVAVVEDTKPVVEILSPAQGFAVYEDVPFDIHARITGGEAPVKAVWDCRPGTPVFAEAGRCRVKFAKAGTYRVTLKATDATGDTAEGSLNVTVIRDTVPKPVIVEPSSRFVITEKEKVGFRGAVTEGNEPVVCTWQFGAGGREWKGLDPGEIAFDVPGNHLVRFTARDADDDVASASVMITVVKDSLPKASIELPEGDEEIYEGESVAFKGSVKDGNQPIRFGWDFRKGARSSDKQEPGEVVFAKAGVYPVTFTVQDSDGDIDAATRTITVIKSTWIAASGGWSHSAGLQMDGTLWAWGLNSYGQLGVGVSETAKLPVRIGTDRDWEKVSVGGAHTLALKKDGSLWAWGANGKGQLGNASTRHSVRPVQIQPGIRWKAVIAGTSHSLAIRQDGSLWAWGRNAEGQLGDGTRDYRKVPVRVGADTDWKLAATGEEHSLALKNDGTLWAWGSNELGQLGDGTRTPSPVPKPVGPDDRWSAVAAGKVHSLAVKADGTLWAWGANMWGRLGDGTMAFKTSPVQIGGDADWKHVAAGEYHSLAMKRNATIWSWGLNLFGELGLGNTRDSTVPVKIGTDSDWIAIEAGDHHSLAVKKNGTLWVWGYNGYSQLGDGGSRDRVSPVINRPTKKRFMGSLYR